ncbi:transcription factor RADIALIS-like [Ricinus communis]|uniref:transcription factor RADIALIS-like n=1 Tax=Ricinus communis TaxID=3988 RepID=UPI00201A7A05|nr:transcription factor RADIALIS-like [Ricinus communis]
MASKETQKWSREENKIFEMNYEHLMKEEWERVALLLPNKTVDDIKLHYKYLLEDIELIESGLVPLPSYADDNDDNYDDDDNDDCKEILKQEDGNGGRINVRESQ